MLEELLPKRTHKVVADDDHETVELHAYTGSTGGAESGYQDDDDDDEMGGGGPKLQCAHQ